MMGCAPCPKPWSGNMENCITLDNAVMAPTYLYSEELKQMRMMLSLA